MSGSKNDGQNPGEGCSSSGGHSQPRDMWLRLKRESARKKCTDVHWRDLKMLTDTSDEEDQDGESATSVLEKGTVGWMSEVLPPGNYLLVGWDVDTTGRRLIDGICQIAAYSRAASFSQYVMPSQKPTPAARLRHNIRIVTVDRIPIMQDSRTKKVLDTKTEACALKNFIKWLEVIKKQDRDGVILVSHDLRKFGTLLLFGALHKHNMQEKFNSVVKGFVNSYDVAQVKCTKTVRSFNLRNLSRVLLHREEELGSAVVRARLSYEIVQHLRECDEMWTCVGGSESAYPSLVQEISIFIRTVNQEEQEIAKLKTILERQNSLQPIFLPMLRQGKLRAIHLRKLLADTEIDYEMLTNTYKLKGTGGIMELLISKLVRVKTRYIVDLKTVVQEHFEGDTRGGDGKLLPQRSKDSSAGNQSSIQNSGDETAPFTSTASDTSSTAPGSEYTPSSQDREKTNEKESGEISSDTDTNSPRLTSSPASPAGTIELPSQEPEERPSSPVGDVAT